MFKFLHYKHCIFSIVLLISLLTHLSGVTQTTVSINEIMASNHSTIFDEDEDFSDWIELYNHGSEEVNLAGWGLTDNFRNPFKWTLPDITLNPGEFLVIWASGKDRKGFHPGDTLISEKSIWKYLDNGTDQGTAWREPGFDDSAWASGPAMLGYDTNNNTDFGTIISFGNNAGNKHIASYFRKDFEITNIEKYRELELMLMIDDGAVVYLNGHEVARRNMPTGTISFNTFANVVVEFIDVSWHVIDASYLVNGTNTLAVQVHQCNRTSSDLRFDLELFSKAQNLHANFSISSEGEEILLTHPELGLIDSVPPKRIPTDVSYGRWPDGTGDFYFYTVATPDSPNNGERFNEVLEPPVFSHVAGFYASPFELAISAANEDISIIYTLDGSVPDATNLGGSEFPFKNSFPGQIQYSNYNSNLYNDPLWIQNRTNQPEYLATFATDYNGTRYTSSGSRLFKGTVVRARAVREGSLPSEEVVATYFVTSALHNRYKLPVLSLVTSPDNMFDYYTGIYTPGVIWETYGGGARDGGARANYRESGAEWERSGHLEFFDGEDTNPALSQHVGFRIHGAWSRAHAQKSIRLYARGSYGESYFNHRLFPDLPYDNYKRFVLRNSGNDWGVTMFRDAAIQAVLSVLRCDVQAYRPSVLFINGEYWGIHNIRERYDRYYLNRTYGVDPENLDILETGPFAKMGDISHYTELTDFLSTNNMALAQNYNHVQTMMDIENFTDYQIGQIFAANTDWPGNNNDFWRLRTDGYQKYAPYGHDGRWRWMVFDTDFGFGWATDVSHNTLRFATEQFGPGWPNPPHSTLVLRRLLLNEEFRYQFINRFADLLNTHFRAVQVNSIINTMRSNLEQDMPEHISRWSRPGNMHWWNSSVDNMVSFSNSRPNYVRQHITGHFNLRGVTNLSINVSDANHGHVRINTLDIIPGSNGFTNNPYPWFGVYFQGVPVQLEAIPAPGYVFSHWEGIDDHVSPMVNQNFTQGSVSIRAHFKKGNLLYGWNFNNLPQDKLSDILSDDANNSIGVIYYEGEGEGYMDRVNQGTILNAPDDIPAGYGLRVRNPSENRQFVIDAPTTGFSNISFTYATMRTANGPTVQEIQYRTTQNGPWLVLDDLVRVEEDWTIKRFGFPSGADNNPDFAIQILFRGDQTQGESGNNRFDNIRIEGLDNSVSVNNPEIDNEGLHNDKIKLWYNNDELFLEQPFRGDSDLTVYNLNGNVIASYSLHGSGQHRVQFSATSGLYIARLQANGVSTTMRFVVVD